MKFSCTVDIDAPREKVVALFEDIDNLKEWQDGFESYEHVSGEEGKVGAKAILKYNNGKQKLELLETITEMNLPERMAGTYEHKHMTNTMTCTFTALSENTTRYTNDIEYTQFNGIMPKLIAWLAPSMFRKQTQKWLDQFKAFVERQ